MSEIDFEGINRAAARIIARSLKTSFQAASSGARNMSQKSDAQ